MIRVSDKQLPPEHARSSHWISWVGYGACAWGLFFATLHATLFFGGGSFTLREQFAHNYGIYLLSSILSVLLFACAALFPLALVWPFRWMSQSRLQFITLLLAYLVMGGFALYEWVVAAEPIAALSACGICVIGAVIVFIRPEGQRVTQWMVFIATWGLGMMMTLYGGGYLYLALHDIHSPGFPGLFFLGGMTWTPEGILFVMTAFVCRCLKH